jgi:dCTP deaminase
MFSGLKLLEARTRFHRLKLIEERISHKAETPEDRLEKAREEHLAQIWIDPWEHSQVNPNSYNLRLHNVLLVYDLETNGTLDMKKAAPTSSLNIPPTGLKLWPGKLYIGRTVEYTESHNCVPCIEGRSSIARLGMSVHITAGFGDVGFCGTWTLEITVVHPIRVYAGVEICQIAFSPIEGGFIPYQSKKYQGQRDATASRLWMELNDDTTGRAETASPPEGGKREGSAKVA